MKLKTVNLLIKFDKFIVLIHPCCSLIGLYALKTFVELGGGVDDALV